MPLIRETPALRQLRMTWTSYLGKYGQDDPRTVKAARELAEARAAAAEAEARRLREAANLLGVQAAAS